MHTIALLGLAAAGASSIAGAAEPQPERPALPSFSLAGEDGAATLWSNPSSLAFDPDPSVWLAWDQQATGGPATFSAALQRGPLGVGALYRNGASQQGWLSLTDAIGLKLGRRFSVGLTTGWQIPEGPENNFLTWDVSASWRPVQWLGVALVAQNLNNPAEDLGVSQSFGGGIALRPLADRVLLGVDYRQSELAPDITGTFSASARLVPVTGLVVRLSGDQAGQIGAGVELYWGRTGLGLHGSGPSTDPSQARSTGYLITADGDHSVFGHGRLVPEFVLDGAFPDQPKAKVFDHPTETWLHLIQRIKAAIEDPAVKGFVLHIDRAPGSWARVQELRDLVAQARSRGKITAAYLDRDAGNAAYFAAVATDHVYLHPAATLDFVGLSMELSYLRGTLDLVGIEPQYVKRSEYKSAPEQWTRTGPSAAARAQLNALLDDLSTDLYQAVAAGRAQPADDIGLLTDQGPFSAADAQSTGLVDGLAYPDQLEDQLEGSFQRQVKLDPNYRLDDRVSGWPAARGIAIIYVSGIIVSGPSSMGGLLSGQTAGSDTIVKQLDQAGRDDAVQAVVLRVDSPGGSAFASDEIWRATQRLRDAGKPLVVSMGGVAASGGYYVSSGADVIFAEPGTITGSIGVFSGKLSAAKLFDAVGISTEILSRGRNAAMYSMSRPLDDEELATMDRLVGVTYDQFKSRVQEGRRLSADEVEQLARGRVWSGSAAVGKRLVDELGGFDAAIARAQQEAGLGNARSVELVTYGDRRVGPLPRRTVQVLARALLDTDGAAATALGTSWLDDPSLFSGSLSQIGTWARLINDPVCALLPWDLEIR